MAGLGYRWLVGFDRCRREYDRWWFWACGGGVEGGRFVEGMSLSSFTTHKMENSEIEKRILELLPKDGTTKGNKYILSELKKSFKELDESEYWKVRNVLIENGKIGRGRGKGGAIFFVTPGPVVERGDRAQRVRESDLYKPFMKSIEEWWTKENIYDNYLIEMTANQGKKKTGGKWTRPDLTLLSVKSYQYVIGRIMDVITFEIKPSDNYGIESVFETASQSIFSHKSYLCIHTPLGRPMTEDFERIELLCENFGIGLLIFEQPDNWDTFDVIIEPKRKEPDPFEVNSFIKRQLCDKTKEKLSSLIRH